jgi:hypothetical protein
MLFDTNIKVLLSESQSFSPEGNNPRDKIQKLAETLRRAVEQL